MTDGLVRSISTLRATTRVTSRVPLSSTRSTSVTTRPKALALVTGIKRPILFGMPAERVVVTALAKLLPRTSVVVAEQL